MIKVIGIDDEQHALETFRRMVSRFDDVEIGGLFDNCQDALQYLQSNEVDAVFLDIEMPDVNGLEFAETILDIYSHISIVFITAYNQYAVEAFEINAVDYILKPLSSKRLQKTIQRLRRRNTENMSNEIYLQCFGRFDVYKGREYITWKNSKAKEILAFLIHQEGVAVGWERIVGAIWPQYDYEKAHANFHANCYILRKRLAEAGIAKIFEHSRDSYRVCSETLSCDAYDFKRLMAEKNVSSLRKAISLYQGGYMEENGYDWALAKAADLEALYLQARRMLEKGKLNDIVRKKHLKV